ncbi:Fis family transcriptional regulator [Thalassotalea atypica]|uniref:Fis family transcriptional regulator n=1 Tax=Thalassotalea atypica TaxID=2054316 RepID=UPI002574507E|nr:Fis family transcriptional regulator [Thalassotalea atypica]
MRKSDKKKDNEIRLALTDVCNNALENISGFQWLTHVVNYDNFPSSLKVICVFDSQASLARCISQDKTNYICNLVSSKLSEIGINVKHLNKQITFDSEEQCQKQDGGRWNHRLNSLPS